MNNKNLKIIGTSHISEESINQIEKEIKENKPDIIAVELDKKRLSALYTNEKDTSAPIYLLKKIGVSGYLFLVIGKYLQKKLGNAVGINPGSDMKTAIDFARKEQIKIVLIDRDIEITLKRFSKTFNIKEKINIIKDIFKSIFQKNTTKEKIMFDLKKVPKKEIISVLMQEMKNKYPNLYNVLVDERNKIMAKKLFKIQRDDPTKKILCVVGAGHEEGIKEHLKQLDYANISYS